MKNVIRKTLALVYNAKVHANHTAIKGKKSGGKRDANGVDWRPESGGSTT